MKLSDFLDSFQGMRKERTFSRAVTLGLLALSLILAVGLVSKKPIVMQIPMNLEGAGEMAHNAASANIKEAWGLTAANLVGNVSPGNVGFVEKALEGLLAPGLYHEMLHDIHMQARAIKEGNITLTFVPSSVFFQASKNRVFVAGDTTRESRFGLPERSKKTYEFVIEIENYRPVIVDWQAYAGGPRINYQPESSEDVERRKKAKEQALDDFAMPLEEQAVNQGQADKNPAPEPQEEQPAPAAAPVEEIPTETKSENPEQYSDTVEQKLKEIL
ncbi:MAG: hypothetical protein M0O99_01685 [Desulfuromonas thiophila]|nr:hypothetical protein [Desulfuromonas thiophila]